MNDTVGIVIVSHSQDIAKGTADMVRQMVGSEVKVAFCGGNPDGGLGTNVRFDHRSDRQAPGRQRASPFSSISAAPRPTAKWLWKCSQPERRDLVVVCNAPIVEGAVMAATEAAGGSSLDEVRAVAEELSAG